MLQYTIKRYSIITIYNLIDKKLSNINYYNFFIKDMVKAFKKKIQNIWGKTICTGLILKHNVHEI